jgi:L-ascorbate metabolism protein UlaG (beta-lactamase superfamily)
MSNVRIVPAVLAFFILIGSASGSAFGQQNRIACGQGMVENRSPLFKPSAIRRVALVSDVVPIKFIGHATFVVRSPQDVVIVTDYNDYYRAGVRPDIATMNTDRGNHSTFRIEPGVTHPLYGWDTGNGIPYHDVTYKDVRVYSEPTNISPMGNRNTNETAIFVIQVGGMCIAHLGHTAHVLDDELVRRLGTIDIVMSPVDRAVTQSYEEIFHNVRALKPRIVIPMHDIGWTTVQFVAEAQRHFSIRKDVGDTIEVSRDTLPRETEVWVMNPRGRFGSY